MITWEMVEIRDRPRWVELLTETPWMIVLTDGRTTRRIEVGQIEIIAEAVGVVAKSGRWLTNRFRFVRQVRVDRLWTSHEHEVYVDKKTVWWKVTYNMPVVGRVQQIVEWPLEEVAAVMKGLVVAKRLRAFTSEPHEAVQVF